MQKAMTEAEFRRELVSELGVSEKEARRILEAQQRVVSRGLKKHGAVATNLGRLRVHRMPAQRGGKKIQMMGREVVTKPKPARTRVKFSARKSLADSL